MSQKARFTVTTPSGLRIVGDRGGPPDAPLVALLHGGGQTRHSWSHVLDRLIGDGYGALCYDARGHGESDWAADGDYSLQRQADDLRAVLAGFPGPIAVVGASMGGMCGFYAIGDGIEADVRALVLVDIVLNPAPGGADKIRRFMRANPDGFATLDEAADAVSAYDPKRPRPADPSGLMKNLRRREDGRLHWHWDPRILGNSPDPEPPSLNAAMLDVAHKVRTPTLLLRGEFSDIVDDKGVQDLTSRVPQTEIVVVPGARHMVAGDPNDDFSKGVIRFVERHLPR